MIVKTYLVLCMFGLFAGTRARFSCKDNAGTDVDWFIMYKTPQTSGNTQNSLQYFYMDSKNRKWVPGEGHITEQNNALYHTLQTVYQNRNADDSAYYLYSDEPPNSDKVADASGKTKGISIQSFFLGAINHISTYKKLDIYNTF